MKAISLYFHIPFCVHRCGYCDFNTYAGLEQHIPGYVQALCKEIRWVSSELVEPLSVHTIFFGGGTPSLLSSQQLGAILESAFQVFSFQENPEISLEANPGTVSLDFFRDLKQLGINRLSLGMQTANPIELRLLERQHNFEDVIKAVSWSRQAGFSNLNLDLIFGIPGQSLDSWQQSISLARQLDPEHLALYALSIEHGTPFQRLNKRGVLTLVNPDLAADMYEWSCEFLLDSGYFQYEISNFAKHRNNKQPRETENPHLACQHNLQYWHNLPYLGFGAGAHGYANKVRTANILSPKSYIERMNKPTLALLDNSVKGFPITPATINAQPVDQRTEIGETLMMGLRLTREGVLEEEFAQRFNYSLAFTFHQEINRLVKIELLEWVKEENQHLRLTPKGRLLGNQVFQEFI